MSRAEHVAENVAESVAERVAQSVAEKRARTVLAAAVFASAMGAGIAGTVSRDVGGVILVFGWVALVYALHAFGRAGSTRAPRDREGEGERGPEA